MDKYENHRLDYTKHGQEQEAGKRSFLTFFILSCVAIASWIFCKLDIKAIMNEHQNQNGLVSAKKESAQPQNNRVFRNTNQTGNHIDEIPMEATVPDVEKVNEPIVAKPNRASFKRRNGMHKTADRVLVPTVELGNSVLKTIKKERLDIVGQQLPEEPIKGPINFNGILIFPVTLSWIEYQIKPGLFPVTETVFSEESSESDENYISRVYYYIKTNDESETNLSKIKFATVKQSLDGKNIDIYEYQEGNGNNRNLLWTIKADTSETIFTGTKYNDSYKITFVGDKYLVANKDYYNFAEVFCGENSVRGSSFLFTDESILTPYINNTDKEKQLYFALATLFFDNDSMRSNLILYLESLRLEESLKE